MGRQGGFAPRLRAGDSPQHILGQKIGEGGARRAASSAPPPCPIRWLKILPPEAIGRKADTLRALR